MNNWKRQAAILLSITAVIVVCQLINSFTSNMLSTSLGLIPRNVNRLWGVIFSPWLHADWAHLWSNLPILLLFSMLILMESIKNYLKVSLFIIICSGLLVWIFGRTANHIGASGWIFGLWAYLIVRSYFQRNLKNFIISGLVIFFYGGIIWGFLPKTGVSFEGHIAGAVSGILYAYIQQRYQLRNKKRR